MPIRPLTRSSLKNTASRLDQLTHHINVSNSKMVATSEQVQRLFLSTPNYAVVGASKDRQKYGNRVLRWYQTRGIEVTPINPKEEEIEGIKTVSSIDKLPSPTETALSIITPPKVTLNILQSAKALDIPALWLQPGAEDDAVREYVREAGLEDRVILGGPCILVLGDGVREKLKAETQEKEKVEAESV